MRFEMENGGSQRSVGMAFQKDFGKVFIRRRRPKQ